MELNWRKLMSTLVPLLNHSLLPLQPDSANETPSTVSALMSSTAALPMDAVPDELPIRSRLRSSTTNPTSSMHNANSVVTPSTSTSLKRKTVSSSAAIDIPTAAPIESAALEAKASCEPPAVKRAKGTDHILANPSSESDTGICYFEAQFLNISWYFYLFIQLLIGPFGQM